MKNVPDTVIPKLKNQNLKLTNYAIKIFDIYQKLKSPYYDSNQLLLKAINIIKSNDIKLQNKINVVFVLIKK